MPCASRRWAGHNGAVITRPPAGTIPEAPGSYQFKDRNGRVIYVGKASNLRQRLSNYFQNPRNMHARTAQMVRTAESVEWTIVANEVEALMLEYSLIKQHDPRFNVRLRDDKSYPFLAVTSSEQWPRAQVMRGHKRKGTRYFGPYAHAYAIRDTLDLLLRSFPVRTCTQGKFNEHERLGRPCLLFHIEKCSGPCVGEIEEMPYRQLVTELCQFLDGDTDEIVNRLEADMKQAATDLEFEQAARLRDRLEAVHKAISKQQMVADKNEDLDVIGIAEDELEASVQMFYIRKGRVVGRKGFILDKVEDLTPGGLINRILENLYGEEPILGVPKQVLVPYEADDRAVYEEWLELARGSKVQIRVPQRGDRVTLLETVTRNAKEEFTRHRMKRASDHNTRSRALTELQDALELPEAPLRIECYDMAHIQGTNYVGSMVVMEDGLPAKREYRRFKVNEVGSAVGGQSDDYAAMAEVVRRRLQAYLDERDRPVSERTGPDGEGVEGKERKPGKFAYPPQLLLVDGGKGQVSATYQVVKELGLADEIPVAGLAKRFEEIYVPGQSQPVELRRGSEALFMLQRIRDEAHRFANTFHRERRSKAMTVSALDDVAGMGDVRKKKLLKAMGGITAVKKASLEDLQEHSFLPDAVAEAIHAKFNP